MTPSLLCAWLRSLGWRRMPAPLSSWDCYTLGVDVVEVPMMGEARDWPRWARECVQDAARPWAGQRSAPRLTTTSARGGPMGRRC